MCFPSWNPPRGKYSKKLKDRKIASSIHIHPSFSYELYESPGQSLVENYVLYELCKSPGQRV
uniref:Uncharacterized protein n=1 Tax=Siphoviridae sp. ctj7g1 TaxID=2826438 RepID=A0A8S5R2V1_9CAUD|nr:MAG TPA: hypothetical protein [Siphoviridae sp. ctj7g1]